MEGEYRFIEAVSEGGKDELHLDCCGPASEESEEPFLHCYFSDGGD